MEVLRLGGAGEALDLVTEPLRPAGADGEVSFDEVSILVGLRSAAPAVLVTMTGVHPALTVGFTETDAVGLRPRSRYARD